MPGRSQHNDSSTSWWLDLPWICVCEKRRTRAGGGRWGLPVGASMVRAALPTNVSRAISAIWPGGINQQHVLALTTTYPFQHTRWCNQCQSQPSLPHDLPSPLLESPPISPSASCMWWTNRLRLHLTFVGVPYQKFTNSRSLLFRKPSLP